MDFMDLIPGYSLLKYGKKKLFDEPATQAKLGYDTAAQQGNQGTSDLVNFYMGQQAKTQALYKPLQGMFNTAYGTGGIQAPQLPPRAPLGAMYGGGK